jgi:WhiB family redox-sensing transcriptional regulator
VAGQERRLWLNPLTTAGTLVYVSAGTATGRAVFDGTVAGSMLWMLDGACSGKSDPAIFYPEKGQSPARAKALCESCPVRARCLEYALALPGWEDWGVWGGTTETQRRVMRGLRVKPRRR